MRLQLPLHVHCAVKSSRNKDDTLRVVTGLYGARGMKQVWRPHYRTWSLSEANVLYWRKYSWHCWDFSTPPAVIWRPRSDFAPRRYAPGYAICKKVFLTSLYTRSSHFIRYDIQRLQLPKLYLGPVVSSRRSCNCRPPDDDRSNVSPLDLLPKP